MTLVFVYGTLLSGEPNHHFLKGARKLGEETTNAFRMVDLGHFPACVEDDNSEVDIFGEIWEITPEILRGLDYLEGYPRFYNRKEIHTSYGKAWIYFNNAEKNAPEITSGNWKQHIHKSTNRKEKTCTRF